MRLIRSFQAKENDHAQLLQATFEDLAMATSLAKKLFKEGSAFPSCKNLFQELPNEPPRTSVLNPVTGKGLVYERSVERVHWQSLLPDSVLSKLAGVEA
jgi:hypothetical protein